MAPKPVSLLFLGALALFVHGVSAQCNVTCSADYTRTLNCTCSNSPLTFPAHIQVTCSDEGDEVKGSCDVGPSQPWCQMLSEALDEIATVETNCTAVVSEVADGVIMHRTESSSWALRGVVKPPPPSSVQVANTGDVYNITWDHSDNRECNEYQVRIRESKDSSKEAANFPTDTKKNLMLDHKRLRPHVNYTVDVRAKLCPGFLYTGPWSEWSSGAEWRTKGTEESPDLSAFWLYVFLPIVFVAIVIVFLGSQRPYLLKKFQLITFIPKPDVFFEPLYHNYGGDFKEWVKPVFSEYDYPRISSRARTLDEKQRDVLQLSKETQSYGEDDEVKPGGHFLSAPVPPHSNSLLFFQEAGSSQGTGHSTGHVSIHTVTLSGEEEYAEEVSLSSVHTLRGYNDEESFGGFEEDSGENVGFDLGRRIRVQPLHQHHIPNDFHPHEIIEPERVSLVSFASNEQSEDGYPHVDLDTIDSGFGECGSPGASDSNIAEQINSDLFLEHKNSNSNYVKQWMVCGVTPEASSAAENQHNETQ